MPQKSEKLLAHSLIYIQTTEMVGHSPPSRDIKSSVLLTNLVQLALNKDPITATPCGAKTKGAKLTVNQADSRQFQSRCPTSKSAVLCSFKSTLDHLCRFLEGRGLAAFYDTRFHLYPHQSLVWVDFVTWPQHFTIPRQQRCLGPVRGLEGCKEEKQGPKH